MGNSRGIAANAAAHCWETERAGSAVTVVMPRAGPPQARLAPPWGQRTQSAWGPSFRFDLAGACDRRPMRNLVRDVLAELLRRHRHHIECLGSEGALHVGVGEKLVDLLVELRRDGLGQLRRSDDAVPGE